MFCLLSSPPFSHSPEACIRGWTIGWNTTVAAGGIYFSNSSFISGLGFFNSVLFLVWLFCFVWSFFLICAVSFVFQITVLRFFPVPCGDTALAKNYWSLSALCSYLNQGNGFYGVTLAYKNSFKGSELCRAILQSSRLSLLQHDFQMFNVIGRAVLALEIWMEDLRQTTKPVFFWL